MNTTLTRLRWASLAEGATLLLLVGVAVPLKRLAGFPEAVSVLGPIHGGAFLLYVAMVLNARQKGLVVSHRNAPAAVGGHRPVGCFPGDRSVPPQAGRARPRLTRKEGSVPVIGHARAHMHLASRLGQLHLALTLGQVRLLFRCSQVVAVGATHALDVMW